MRSFLLILLALGGASFASAQSITEIGPAASYIPTGLPGGGIAQGSFFYIKGSGLGPATGVVFSAASANYSMGAELAGTRVRVTVLSTVVEAFPYYTSASQVNVILPSNTPVGAGTVTVFYNGTSATYPITVVRAAYGVFTLNSAGSGPAVVTNAVTGSVITLTNALHPGEIGTLWGTGLGAVSFPDNQPAQLQRLEGGVTMLIGGKAATISYAGRAPGFSGLDQINFTVPDGVSGCGVPLVVRIASLPSNFVTIPVATTGNVCSDPNGLSASDLSNAQANGLSIGEISLTRVSLKFSQSGISFDSKSDVASGTFSKFDFNSLIRSNSESAPPNGSCIVSLFKGQSDPGDPVLPVFLDAGAKLTLNGPGVAKDLLKSQGIYEATGSAQTITGLPGGVPGNSPGLFLEPGAYTINGTGGAQVGAFSASINLPTPLVWTNQAAISSVARSQDLRVTWTGGGSGQAIILGVSANAAGVGGSFVCFENANAGGFTVPSYVLSALPTSGGSDSAGVLQVGSYGVGPRFNASGIDYGFTSYSTFNMATVNYQ